MANMFYSMLLFGVCLQLASYILWAFGILNAIGINYPMGNANQIGTLTSVFSYAPFLALIGGTGIAFGIIALLTRAGSFPIYAVLIFSIGIFVPVVGPFFLAIPNTIAALIPSSTNPLPGQINPIATVIGVAFIFAIFFYIFEMTLQRKVT